MAGPKNWDEAAGIVWPVLTAAAQEGRLLTYGELAPMIRTNPLSVGRALGPIQDYCLEGRLPPLTAIVVSATTGVPGDGFIAWDIDDVDSAIQGVYNFNWTRIENPFSGFIDGASEASLADLSRHRTILEEFTD